MSLQANPWLISSPIFSQSTLHYHFPKKDPTVKTMSYELERIEQLCRDRGWSHYRLALEMDTSPNNIGNLFRRTTVPSVPTLRRICEVMGITMAQFYSADGVPVTLTQQQKHILDLFDSLDQEGKLKAEAYMEGLSDYSRCRET